MTKYKEYNKSDSLSLEAQNWLKQAIRKEYPEWADEDGNCTKCINFYSRLSSLEEVLRDIHN